MKGYQGDFMMNMLSGIAKPEETDVPPSSSDELPF
jgi:hypothetical protein